MSERNYKRISPKEAMISLGVYPLGENTYILSGIFLKVLNEGLEITYPPNKMTKGPSDSFFTASPFEFSQNGQTYLLRSENNHLVIDRKRNIVGSEE